MRRICAIAGIVGPSFFALVVLTLSIVQYPFMRSLGWDPLSRPTYDWPSGLALGPYGWIMTSTFLISGVFLALLAWGLRSELEGQSGQIGTMLMMWSGVALMGLAFTTDRVVTPVPISWHGKLHDLSFLAMGLLLIPAMIMLGLSFRQSRHWGQLSLFTWVTAALAIPTFAVKGFVFYAFLLAVLAWNVITAIYLLRVTAGSLDGEQINTKPSDWLANKK